MEDAKYRDVSRTTVVPVDIDNARTPGRLKDVKSPLRTKIDNPVQPSELARGSTDREVSSGLEGAPDRPVPQPGADGITMTRVHDTETSPVHDTDTSRTCLTTRPDVEGYVSDASDVAASPGRKTRKVPDVRWDLVRRVKAEIEAGTYETPERLDATVERLAEILFPKN